jgi:hypothetical protein
MVLKEWYCLWRVRRWERRTRRILKGLLLEVGWYAY